MILEPRKLSLAILPGFSFLDLCAVIDVVRLANYASERQRYSWVTVSEQPLPVRASNGMQITADNALDNSLPCSMAPHDPLGSPIRDHLVVLFGGVDRNGPQPPRMTGWLRRMARQGSTVCGIGTGVFVLAKAGLLEGHACTLSWELATSFREEFPNVELRNSLYVVDRNRLTCAGATATFDLFLHLVAADYGTKLARNVAQQLQLKRIRSSNDDSGTFDQGGIRRRSEALSLAVAAMEDSLDSPLGVNELARLVGLTRRQLHRLFRDHFGKCPSEYYRSLRLHQARLLLQNPSRSITEAAEATGFSTHSHFTKCYRQQFGVSPRLDRQISDESATCLPG